MDDKEQIKNIIKPPKTRKVNIEKLFHTMPDGTIMSGKTHNKKSKVIKKVKKNKNKKKY